MVYARSPRPAIPLQPPLIPHAHSKRTPKDAAEWCSPAGIEYGNVDEYFDLVDRIADGIKPSDPPGPPTPENPIDKPGSGISIGDIIDICCPNLSDLIDQIGKEIKNRTALLGIIRVEAYAMAFESVDIPVLFGKQAANMI